MTFYWTEIRSNYTPNIVNPTVVYAPQGKLFITGGQLQASGGFAAHKRGGFCILDRATLPHSGEDWHINMDSVLHCSREGSSGGKRRRNLSLPNTLRPAG